MSELKPITQFEYELESKNNERIYDIAKTNLLDQLEELEDLFHTEQSNLESRGLESGIEYI